MRALGWAALLAAISAVGCVETGPPPYLRVQAGLVDGEEVRYNQVVRSEVEAVWEGREVVRFETDNLLTVLVVSLEVGVASGEQRIHSALVRLPEANGSKWYCSLTGRYELGASGPYLQLNSLSRLDACNAQGPHQVHLEFSGSVQNIGRITSDFPPLSGAVFIDNPSAGAYTFEGPGISTYLSSQSGFSKVYLASFGAAASSPSDYRLSVSCPTSSTLSPGASELSLKGLQAEVRCPGTPVDGFLHFRR